MKGNRKKLILTATVKKTAGTLILLVVIGLVNLAVFYLYNLNVEPFVYSLLLGAVGFAIYYGITYVKEHKAATQREHMYQAILASTNGIISLNQEDGLSLEDADYYEMLAVLEQRVAELETRFDINQTDMNDYYTTWVHQIKTPIAVMRMLLTEDSDEHRALLSELFRIEQYVDMALVYIRLDATGNDLVVREYDLDDLVRQSIRKFASQFIGRKLSMSFQETNQKIVTDQKWFSTILEQILSNAVKYTPNGGISIYFTEDSKLCIKDTGIGISKEDLPRVFEKGYTGINGRGGEKSSGLGLYLCAKAADKLHIPLSVESEPGVGTTFMLKLNQEQL